MKQLFSNQFDHAFQTEKHQLWKEGDAWWISQWVQDDQDSGNTKHEMYHVTLTKSSLKFVVHLHLFIKGE